MATKRDALYAAVYVVPTTDDGTGTPEHVGVAASKTEAIREARRAGYRVMQVGGLVQYGPGIRRDGSDVWSVTVYPKAD